MQKHRRTRVLLGLGLGLLVLLAATVYAAGERMERSAVSSGGGVVEGAGMGLRTVMGQPVTGLVSKVDGEGGLLALCSGLECAPIEATPPAETATPIPTSTSTATPTSTSTPTPTPTPQEVTVDVLSNTFDPAEITIRVGDTVTWVRQEGVHSVTADDGSFEQPAGDDWSTFSHTFTQAGEFPYYCSVHGSPGGQGMSGKVIVQAPPTATPTATATPTSTVTPTPTGTVTPGQTPTPTTVPEGDDLYLPHVSND